MRPAFRKLPTIEFNPFNWEQKKLKVNKSVHPPCIKVRLYNMYYIWRQINNIKVFASF